jgi:NADH:ubiquinone oxidoreductase subunit C
MVPEVLAGIEFEMSADIDEVVCRVPAGLVDEAARRLKQDGRTSFKYLRLLCVVDYEEQGAALDVVYHIYSMEHQHKMVLKARVLVADPELPSVTPVWRGANWYEREMHDLFGVIFVGHPDMRTLILPDGFEGFPGRKSFPLHEYDEW